MATARAIASGNWSATSTWNGGVLPGNGDTVYSNGFTVTIDQNITIGGANNPIVNAGSFVSGQWYEITSVGTTSFTGIGAAANTVGIVFLATGAGSGTGQARARATLTTAANTPAGAAAGGGFAMSSTYNMTCDLRAGTTACLTVTSSANLTLDSLRIEAGTSNNANALNYSSTGTITGSALIITGGTNSIAINNSSAGTIDVNLSTLTGSSGGSGPALSNISTGSVTLSNATINGGTAFNSQCINNTGAGNITISSSTLTAGGNSVCIVNSTTGTIAVSNSTINASSTNGCITNSSTGSVVCVNCTFSATNGFSAITSTNTNAINRFSGTFISSTNGTQPINATRWILNSSPTGSYIQHALDGINANSFVRYFTADTSLGQAAPTDVRSGVTYASGNLTGRLTIPARGTVASGVNLGPNMPFTATRSGTTATATLTYSYPYQVGDVITVTGASNNEWNGDYTITEVVSGTSVRWTVPATHSATAGTGANAQTKGTAVLDGSSVAAAVWGAATRTLTSASGPTAVEIRQEMDTNSTKLANLDATVSSRLAASAVNTTRLANVATVESTGAALAAALTAP